MKIISLNEKKRIVEVVKTEVLSIDESDSATFMKGYIM
jgi:hypothetical protein